MTGILIKLAAAIGLTFMSRIAIIFIGALCTVIAMCRKLGIHSLYMTGKDEVQRISHETYWPIVQNIERKAMLPLFAVYAAVLLFGI